MSPGEWRFVSPNSLIFQLTETGTETGDAYYQQEGLKLKIAYTKEIAQKLQQKLLQWEFKKKLKLLDQN